MVHAVTIRAVRTQAMLFLRVTYYSYTTTHSKTLRELFSDCAEPLSCLFPSLPYPISEGHGCFLGTVSYVPFWRGFHFMYCTSSVLSDPKPCACSPKPWTPEP